MIVGVLLVSGQTPVDAANGAVNLQCTVCGTGPAFSCDTLECSPIIGDPHQGHENMICVSAGCTETLAGPICNYACDCAGCGDPD